MSGVYGILGGDRRQIYLARSIAADGYPVCISCLGHEKGADGLEQPSLEQPSLEPPSPLPPSPEQLSVEQVPPEELLRRSDLIILPLPVTRDGKTLNTPLSAYTVALDDGFAAECAGKAVYGGMMEKLLQTSPLWGGISTYDYYAREELMVGNAFLTAEGALGVAIREYEGAINGAHCLVTGFGRIGKALCMSLKGLGAKVDCCARKSEDLTAIRAIGCAPLKYEEIHGAYDVIFNTVPARVLTAQILSRQRPDTLLIELASQPGGMDLEAAQRLKLRVKNAPSIPGRMSPRAAGELIKETIYNMISGL